MIQTSWVPNQQYFIMEEKKSTLKQILQTNYNFVNIKKIHLSEISNFDAIIKQCIGQLKTIKGQLQRIIFIVKDRKSLIVFKERWELYKRYIYPKAFFYHLKLKMDDICQLQTFVEKLVNSYQKLVESVQKLESKINVHTGNFMMQINQGSVCKVYLKYVQMDINQSMQDKINKKLYAHSKQPQTKNTLQKIQNDAQNKNRNILQTSLHQTNSYASQQKFDSSLETNQSVNTDIANNQEKRVAINSFIDTTQQSKTKQQTQNNIMVKEQYDDVKANVLGNHIMIQYKYQNLLQKQKPKQQIYEKQQKEQINQKKNTQIIEEQKQNTQNLKQQNKQIKQQIKTEINEETQNLDNSHNIQYSKMQQIIVQNQQNNKQKEVEHTSNEQKHNLEQNQYRSQQNIIKNQQQNIQTNQTSSQQNNQKYVRPKQINLNILNNNSCIIQKQFQQSQMVKQYRNKKHHAPIELNKKYGNIQYIKQQNKYYKKAKQMIRINKQKMKQSCKDRKCMPIGHARQLQKYNEYLDNKYRGEQNVSEMQLSVLNNKAKPQNEVTRYTAIKGVWVDSNGISRNSYIIDNIQGLSRNKIKLTPYIQFTTDMKLHISENRQTEFVIISSNTDFASVFSHSFYPFENVHKQFIYCGNQGYAYNNINKYSLNPEPEVHTDPDTFQKSLFQYLSHRYQIITGQKL